MIRIASDPKVDPAVQWWQGEGSAEPKTFAQQFTALAPYYDELMACVPYAMWVDYVELLFRMAGAKPSQVVDLACGTGNVTFELASRGYETTGVDSSAAMLRQAERKRKERGVSGARFLRQDLRNLDLPEGFDAAVCLYDSLNYILEEGGLLAAFRGVRRCLRRGGLFVCDFNSVYALEADLFSQDNLGSKEPLKHCWRSHYEPRTRLCEVEMYFRLERNGEEPLYFREKHLERAYDLDQIEVLFGRAGLERVHTFDAYTTSRPHRRSERWFFVCRRP